MKNLFKEDFYIHRTVNKDTNIIDKFKKKKKLRFDER